MIGMAIAQRLEQEGKVGATHMGTGFDAWYPGYIDYNPVFKNIPPFWTETQGTGPAPRTSEPGQVPADMRRPQALYASPSVGGTWRLRDAVDYMVTASTATLDYAAKYKESLLFGRYQAGRDQFRKAGPRPPTPTCSRKPNAIQWRRSNCCDGSHLPASACTDSPTRPTWRLRRPAVRPHRR